jgi:hypothetical protein
MSDENRCESIDPIGLLGKNTRCDLDKGHAGQHRARKHTYDGWESEARWNPDPVQDELRALRKVAEAALAVYRAWVRDLHHVNKMFAMGRELRDAGYELKPTPPIGGAK